MKPELTKMSMLNYYKGPYNVYYSTTFRVSSHSVVLHSYKLQARIKVESVAYDNEDTLDSLLSMEKYYMLLLRLVLKTMDIRILMFTC